MFSNEQIAHDIATARMAGKQLPAKELVEEYRSCYEIVLEYLDANPKDNSLAKTEAVQRPF